MIRKDGGRNLKGDLGSVDDVWLKSSHFDDIMADEEVVLGRGGGRGILVCRAPVLDQAERRPIFELWLVVADKCPDSGCDSEASLTM